MYMYIYIYVYINIPGVRTKEHLLGACTKEHLQGVRTKEHLPSVPSVRTKVPSTRLYCVSESWMRISATKLQKVLSDANAQRVALVAKTWKLFFCIHISI